jgi:hypothetical protein
MILNPSSVSPLETFDKNSQFDERYTIGADLGQSHDPTAIAVVRRLDDRASKPIFQVGHLERLPLGTSYPNVVSHVTNMLGRPQLRGKAELVIDFTGVGRPVFEMFIGRGVSPIGVTITAGEAISHEGLVWRVPKIILISRIQALLHDGRLKIHKDLPDAAALVAELQDFRADVTDSGYWKFGARAGKHDDLVLALAIALWRAHGDSQHTGLLEYYKHAAVRGGFSESKPSVQKVRVTLRSPAPITTVYTAAGRSLNVSDDGTFDLDEDEAIPLLQAGWVKVAA